MNVIGVRYRGRRGGLFGHAAAVPATSPSLSARPRHPQSLGWTVLLLGIAIASRSVIALVLVVAFCLFAARCARIEDRQLSARLGEAFERYRRRTRATRGVS